MQNTYTMRLADLTSRHTAKYYLNDDSLGEKGPIRTRSWFVFVSRIGQPFQVAFVSQGRNLIFTIRTQDFRFSYAFEVACVVIFRLEFPFTLAILQRVNYWRFKNYMRYESLCHMIDVKADNKKTCFLHELARHASEASRRNLTAL